MAVITNLNGNEKIKESFEKINDNDNALNEELAALILGSANATIGAYPISISGTNTYSGTFASLAYFVGLFINMVGVTPNTGAATLNINALGAKDIKIRLQDGTLRDAKPGELHDELQVIYDGTQFIVVDMGATEAYSQSLTPKLLGGGLIINGNFDVWQRGVIFPSAANLTYIADRWVKSVTAPVDDTITQEAFSPGQAEVPNNPKYYMRVALTVNQAAGSNIRQRIEDVSRFSNKKITLSLWTRDSIQNTSSLIARLNFGSGGSPSIDAPSKPITHNTSWTKTEVTFDIPDITGKTIGTDSYLELLILNNVNNQAHNWDIAQVKMDYGDLANEFIPKTFAEELLDCQRYYEIIGIGAYGVFTFSFAAQIFGNYRVQKRITPTLILSTSSPQLVEPGVAVRTGTASTISAITSDQNGCGVSIDGFTGATVGNGAAANSDVIIADAEL